MLTARPPERLFHLVFESPWWKGLGAESEEKREPVSDIDTGVVVSLKVLDPDGRLEKRTSRTTSPAIEESAHPPVNSLPADSAATPVPTGRHPGARGRGTRLATGFLRWRPRRSHLLE